MNNKSSPRSRPSRKAPTSVRSGVRRPRANVASPTPPQDPENVTAQQRLRRFLTVIGIPNLVLVLAVIVVAFACVLFAGETFAALPAAIGEAWFITHLVPVSFQGVTLGVLPLAPALGVIALIASSVHRAVKDRVSILDLAAILGVIIVIPLTLSGIAWFMVWDATKVFPLEAPSVGLTILHPVAIHLIGLIIGMGPTLWKALARRFGIAEVLVDGATRAHQLMLRLAGAALIVYLAVLIAGHERLGELAAAYPALSGLGVVGLVVVSLLYLPNAIVGTLAVLFGGQVSIGAASVSLFAIDLVPLPVFPLFAAIPGTAAAWAPVLLLIPFAVVVHYAITRAWDGPMVAATAVFAGMWALVAAYFVSGQLGGYGYSGPVHWLIAVLATAWVGLIAGAVWGIAVLRNRSVEDVASAEEASVEEAPPEEASVEEESVEADVVEDPEDEGVEEPEDPEEPEESEELEDTEDEEVVDKPEPEDSAETETKD
ncbi:cell division protein PerM [Corynebacterium pilosum]|uniref:cell division protein PerM n=2 Tax=Corynebacterium pilosum TaxID=35756 RepID=UPI001FD192F4|nr:DUF6350 family protein [Corynebacterium pilosum]